MTIAREPIFAAHFALLQAITTGSPPASPFKTTSRRLRHWTDVPESERPYLCQAQGNEEHAWTHPALEAEIKLHAKLYIYVVNGSGDDAAPGTVLNPLLDAIQALYGPGATDPNTRKQTLGGLVKHARIEGEVLTFEGTLGNTEVAIVPIELLVTSEMA